MIQKDHQTKHTKITINTEQAQLAVLDSMGSLGKSWETLWTCAYCYGDSLLIPDFISYFSANHNNVSKYSHDCVYEKIRPQMHVLSFPQDT